MKNSQRVVSSGAVRRIGLALALAGFDARAMTRAARAIPRFVGDFRRFSQLSAAMGRSRPSALGVLPALADRKGEAGSGSSEYFLADLWAARLVRRMDPLRHVDVGSRIDGFVAHLLAFRDVEVVDIRPLRSAVAGLHFIQSDATSLADIESASLPSVSSLHALEHFGLGRYGDPLDPDGHVKGIKALGRVTAPGGDLYIGVPAGRPTIEFNAHRVLDVCLVPSLLREYELLEFAFTHDGVLHESADLSDVNGLRYACALYHLRRLA